MLKILVTGGDGRFAKELKKIRSRYKFVFRNKKQLDILSIKSIKNNIKKFNPNIILHLAGLSRPMNIHEKKINKSIDLNIIGTANLVKVCRKNKRLFFSTSYVYPGTKEITKRMIHYYHGIIMDGLNLVQNVRFECTKIH